MQLCALGMFLVCALKTVCLAQTFAARGSIVGPASWTLAACYAALRASAFPFAVASAVLYFTQV